MKKFLMVVLITIAVSTTAFGATSNDVYLRQDVFDAKMDAFMAEIRLMNEQTKAELRKEIQETKNELRKEIQDTKAELTEKILANTKAIQETNAQVAVNTARLDSLVTMIYWGIAFITIFISLIAIVMPIVLSRKDASQHQKLIQEEVERALARLQIKDAQGA